MKKKSRDSVLSLVNNDPFWYEPNANNTDDNNVSTNDFSISIHNLPSNIQLITDTIIISYNTIEKLRLDLWKCIWNISQSNLNDDIIKKDSADDLINSKVKASFDNNVVHITVQDLLPNINAIVNKKIISGYKTLWLNYIEIATSKLRLNKYKLPLFDKAYCLITTVYANPRKPWDVDNRVYNYIINALRIFGFIKNDQWNNLTLVKQGKSIPSGVSTTEIYLTDNKNILLSLLE